MISEHFEWTTLYLRLGMEYEVVIAVAYTSESGSNVIMSTPKKSPTEKEKSHSKLKDFFGSMQNLSDKHDKQEKIEKKHKETNNSKSQSSKRKSRRCCQHDRLLFN